MPECVCGCEREASPCGVVKGGVGASGNSPAWYVAQVAGGSGLTWTWTCLCYEVAGHGITGLETRYRGLCNDGAGAPCASQERLGAVDRSGAGKSRWAEELPAWGLECSLVRPADDADTGNRAEQRKRKLNGTFLTNVISGGWWSGPGLKLERGDKVLRC